MYGSLEWKPGDILINMNKTIIVVFKKYNNPNSFSSCKHLSVKNYKDSKWNKCVFKKIDNIKELKKVIIKIRNEKIKD